MKKLIFIFILGLLGGCIPEEEVKTLQAPSPDQEIPLSREGLELSLSQRVYTESPTVIDTSITNNSQQDYEYGDYYYIEVNKNGDWYTLVHSDAVFLNNPQLKDFGHTLPAGREIQQAFSIDMLGVTLYPGDYRLVKTFLSQGMPYHEVSLAFPFTVE